MVLLMGKTIMKKDFEEDTLDHLRNKVEEFINMISNKLLNVDLL